MPSVLGIDTSAYTASLALVDTSGECLREMRCVLPVATGGRGLRQSDAVFEHIRQLPALFEELYQDYDDALLAICASDAPRHVEGSYMPVFCVGASFAKALAASLRVPCFFCSHQEGHLMAAWWQHRRKLQGAFLAMHLSGGTTELLRAERMGLRYKTDLIGKTLDLHAGQLVDRIGVAMGGRFPSGPQMERWAQAWTGPNAPPFKTHNKDADMNLSGLEQQAMRAMRQYGAPQVAALLYAALSETFASSIAAAVQTTGLKQVLLFGGVAGSMRLRRLLRAELDRLKVDVALYFGETELSSDNAVGVARMGQSMYDMSK